MWKWSLNLLSKGFLKAQCRFESNLADCTLPALVHGRLTSRRSNGAFGAANGGRSPAQRTLDDIVHASAAGTFEFAAYLPYWLNGKGVLQWIGGSTGRRDHNDGALLGSPMAVKCVKIFAMTAPYMRRCCTWALGTPLLKFE
jgi:hypothetical protein